MRSFTDTKHTESYRDWIDSELGPNVYAVATLKQAIKVDHNGSAFWIPGDPHIYESGYNQFIRRLSSRLYGKAYRRYGKIIPNAATLEGNGTGHRLTNRRHRASLDFMKNIQPVGDGVRYHLNVMLRRPEWLPFDELHSRFMEEWAHSDWAMPDVFLEERTGDCPTYSLKDGPQTLLIHSLRF
jgi:hypothetical protein